ncbi:hypothetical protein HK102_001919 [Quaeritorhiza haematococci]|nr:hypothetical protein HK102_001919 [Quaeritorhiza haematococci]
MKPPSISHIDITFPNSSLDLKNNYPTAPAHLSSSMTNTQHHDVAITATSAIIPPDHDLVTVDDCSSNSKDPSPSSAPSNSESISARSFSDHNDVEISSQSEERQKLLYSSSSSSSHLNSSEKSFEKENDVGDDGHHEGHEKQEDQDEEEEVLFRREDLPAAPTFSRIVMIAVDKSDYSEYAFTWAIKNVIRLESDQVVVINVRPVLSLVGPYGMYTYVDMEAIVKMEQENKTESHRLLRDFLIRLQKRKVACRAIAMRGDARGAIMRKVEELDADILIVGSRGLGGALQRRSSHLL